MIKIKITETIVYTHSYTRGELTELILKDGPSPPAGADWSRSELDEMTEQQLGQLAAGTWLNPRVEEDMQRDGEVTDTSWEIQVTE